MACPSLTAGQLLQAVQADAPLLFLIAVDASARSDGLGLPCRVVGTIPQGGFAPLSVAPPSVAPPSAAPLSQPGEDCGRHIARMLAAVGVPTNLLGYGYLRTALTLMLAQPEMSHGLMRSLYPEVALRHATTARCVERAIRHAISQAWARGGGEDYSRLLGRGASIVGEKPTNSEFLAQMAEGLRLEMAPLEECAAR